MKLTIIGRPGEGKSTLSAWLLKNLPRERFKTYKIDNNEISVKLIKTALPSNCEASITEEACRRC